MFDFTVWFWRHHCWAHLHAQLWQSMDRQSRCVWAGEIHLLPDPHHISGHSHGIHCRDCFRDPQLYTYLVWKGFLLGTAVGSLLYFPQPNCRIFALAATHLDEDWHFKKLPQRKSCILVLQSTGGPAFPRWKNLHITHWIVCILVKCFSPAS